ncbi:MAG TPA: transglutaminaseTgpA domain-containing protein, partial [Candidatus Xenobia bacterium]
MAERRRWFQFRPLPVENSIPLRAWTLAVVLIGVLAILNEEEWPSFGWLVVGLTVLGYTQSHYRRGRPNWALKLVIVGCMFWAMRAFFLDLMTSANDPRIPLATLLMWLQTLHAYDLPYRHNLNVSFFVGIVLMAVAAVLSTTAAFAGFLLAFVVAGMFMLQHSYLSWRAEMEARSGMSSQARVAPVTALPQVRSMAMARRLPVWLALLLVGSGIVYVCVPHLSGLRIRTLPISMVRAFPHMGGGTVVNPAYPGGVGPQTAARGGKVFDPNSYTGFNSYMDLTVRGELSHDVVMRVRSSRVTYYRALAFDHYDGRGWQISHEDKLDKVTSAQPPVQISTGRFYGQEDLVQIFYLDHDMSNVIMGAYHISQVYFPGDTLYVDHNDGVRADFALGAGTTYSVVSRVSRDMAEGRLKTLDALKDHTHRDWKPYLQLPDTLPAGVRDVAG